MIKQKKGSNTCIWDAVQHYTFSFGNLTPPNPRLVDHKISGASENSHVWRWLSYCYKTDLNENLISFIFELESRVLSGMDSQQSKQKTRAHCVLFETSRCLIWIALAWRENGFTVSVKLIREVD